MILTFILRNRKNRPIFSVKWRAVIGQFPKSLSSYWLRVPFSLHTMCYEKITRLQVQLELQEQKSKKNKTKIQKFYIKIYFNPFELIFNTKSIFIKILFHLLYDLSLKNL